MGKLADKIRARTSKAREQYRAHASKCDDDFEVLTTPKFFRVDEPDALPTSLIPGVRRLPKPWRMFGAGVLAATLFMGYENWHRIIDFFGSFLGFLAEDGASSSGEPQAPRLVTPHRHQEPAQEQELPQ